MFLKLSALVAACVLPATITAHSWNEQLSLIGQNGSFVANGYPRGYVARTDPGYNGNSMLWLIPGADTQRIHINASDLLCHPNQRQPTQTPNYPRLAVAPGSAVAMKYLENGHVSLPQNQPGKQPKAGTVFVFGTTQPDPSETLSNVLKWTADGSGGDKRGKLLQAQNFDDDRCYQINSGTISTQRQQQFPDPNPGQPGTKNEQWCESNAVIPTDAPVGKPYTVYWVWQWPTMPGGNGGYPTGKDEYYTTCSDFDVQAQAPQTGVFNNVLKQQDPQQKPVADYLSRTALEPTPWPSGVTGAAGASSSAAPAPSSTPAAAAPAAPAPSSTVAAAAPAAPAATTPAPAPQASTAPAAAQGASQAAASVGTPTNALEVLSTLQATPAPASTQAPAAPAAASSMLTPMPLAAFTPAASAPSAASTAAPVAATTAAATTPAPVPAVTGTTAAAAPMQVVTVPAGSPVFMFNNGQVVTLARRAAPSARPLEREAAARLIERGGVSVDRRRHRVGGKHGRWFGR